MGRRDKTTKSIMTKVQKSADSLVDIVNSIVKEYCTDLDDLMEELAEVISDDITDTELEKAILQLSSQLYFTGTGQENIGIKEDVCKAIRSEVYNDSKSYATGTISDKTAFAELQTRQETLVLNIYNRAYKKMKQRMESGYEMLNSLKKIMNKRLAEYEMSNSRYIDKVGENAR